MSDLLIVALIGVVLVLLPDAIIALVLGLRALARRMVR